MNLIQIQDRLKELPSSPQSMQLLMGYANGTNPMVPPYLALSELQRRNKMMQEQASAPQGTVKDQIEQASGIASLSQQGQGMAQMQPQAIPQPVQMARGGLLDLMRLNSGGVIAFNEAGSVDEAEEEALTSREMMANAIQERQRLMDERPKYVSPLDVRQAILKERPELAEAVADKTGDMLARFDEMQAARREEYARQKEEAVKPSVLQLLGRAALGSRGQFGKSALGAILGGYEQLQSGADARALEQEQSLRMRELELQQARAEALNKIDEIKRARAEGDLNKEMVARKEYEGILLKHDTSTNQLFGRMTSAAGRLAGAEKRAETEIAKSKEATDRATKLAEMAKERALAVQAEIAKRARQPSTASAEVGLSNAQRKSLEAEAKILRDQAKDISLPEDSRAAISQRMEEIRKQLQGLGPAAPAAPSTKIMKFDKNGNLIQ